MSTSAFRDLGRVANAAETRTCVLNKGTDGDFYFVICANEFITCTNLRTKESGYYPYPNGYRAFPFGSMGAKTGKVYIGAGRYLFEFDPAAKEYTFAGMPHPDEVISADAWTFVEADDGMIYFGACPKTYLTGFDPKTRTFIDYGEQDAQQQYLGSVAVDKEGWLYSGIGTANSVITAVNLTTKEKRVLLHTDRVGGACVCTALDGTVYATEEGGTAFFPYDPNKTWFRLSGGEICEEMTESFDNGYFTCGIGFNRVHCPYGKHPTLLYQDLINHELRYIHPETGEEVEITLPYETVGAKLTHLSEGPDGKIYGTTNHPNTFFVYDPETETLTDYLNKIRSHDIETYAYQGSILAGLAYCGGHLVRIDTTKPITPEGDVNPFVEASYDEVLRPRSACALPDGRRVVFGGYNAYGVTGGGLVVYDTVDRSSYVIENKKLIPAQSVLSIVPMSEDLILCGTCIDAPGGGIVTAKEAELFLFDLKTETVLWSVVPLPGAKTLSHMEKGTDGLIHGVTVNATHFVFDIEKREVVFSEDLSAYLDSYGQVPRASMITAPDGTIWGIFNRAIYRIKPGTLGAEIVAKPPKGISTGIGLVDGKLYVGSGSHLWEYTIE